MSVGRILGSSANRNAPRTLPEDTRHRRCARKRDASSAARHLSHPAPFRASLVPTRPQPTQGRNLAAARAALGDSPTAPPKSPAVTSGSHHATQRAALVDASASRGGRGRPRPPLPTPRSQTLSPSQCLRWCRTRTALQSGLGGRGGVPGFGCPHQAASGREERSAVSGRHRLASVMALIELDHKPISYRASQQVFRGAVADGS